MTKPIVAVGALLLVEECRLRLDDPVDELLPELADRRVLVDAERRRSTARPSPAQRPITVRDVLTFRLGLGMDFEAPWPQPLLEAMGAARPGRRRSATAAACRPSRTSGCARLATLPLLYQPGERWLYNTGSDVLGVLVARAAGQPLEEFLRERVFEPLGHGRHRVLDRRTPTGSARATRWIPETGELIVYDAPDGQWASRRRSRRAAAGSCRRSTTGRLRPHAAGRRAAARRVTIAVAGVRRGDDDRPHRRRPGARTVARRLAGLGVRRRRAGAPDRAGARGRQLRMGRRPRLVVGQRSRKGLIGVVLTTDTFSGAFPPPPSSRTSGPAPTRRSGTRRLPAWRRG